MPLRSPDTAELHTPTDTPNASADHLLQYTSKPATPPMFIIDTRLLTSAPIGYIRFSLLTRRVQIKWFGYNPYSYTIRRRDQLKIVWREIREPRCVRYGRLANWIKESDLT